jgi:hypothetical protein
MLRRNTEDTQQPLICSLGHESRHDTGDAEHNRWILLMSHLMGEDANSAGFDLSSAEDVRLVGMCLQPETITNADCVLRRPLYALYDSL